VFKLYPAQVAHTERLEASLRRFGCALDTSDTGTGKTLCAVDLAHRLGRHPVVVAPKPVLPAWRKYLADRQWRDEPIVVNYEALRSGRHPLWPGRWELPPTALLIFDEVQRCKSPKSRTSKLLATSVAIPTLSLSATAASNPVEMKSLGLRYGLFDRPGAHYRWCLRNGCKPGQFGGLKFVGGEEVIEEIHGELSPYMSRLRRRDIPEFPETLIQNDPIDFGSQLVKIWSDLEARLDALPRGQSLPVVEILRARQEAELVKVAYIVDAVEDGVIEGNAVAVFLNFSDSIDALASALHERGIRAEEYSGRTTSKRDQFAEDFRGDRLGVVLVQVAAGGVGLSLHGARPRLALHSPTWSGDQHLQALGRVHRAGGGYSLQRILTCGDIETRVQKKAEKKIKHIEILNEG